MCLILTPFAWLKIVIHKILLAKRSGIKSFYLQSMGYLVFGLPILILTAFVDCYWFIIHLFQWKVTSSAGKSNFPKISLKAFNKFYSAVNNKSGKSCNAKDLVLEVRDLFGTTECIFGVLYANKTSVIDEKVKADVRPETPKSKREHLARNTLKVVGEIG